MDYSQFLAMKQEIGLLVVFLLVFLYDTFMPRKALKGIPVFTTVLIILATAAGFCSHARPRIRWLLPECMKHRPSSVPSRTY